MIVLTVLVAGSITILTLLGGCEREVRHQWLTFFFDGVPPMDGSGGSGTLAGAPTSAPTATSGTVVPVGSRSIHQPVRDCNRCHIYKQENGMQQIQLNRPVPDQCYECHTNYAVAQAYVHGPVAVGTCLWCHEPHKSALPYLLKMEEPQLCTGCHEASMLSMIPGHDVESTRRCTSCHEPHISTERALLKQAPTG